jgi:hypothetical protein
MISYLNCKGIKIPLRNFAYATTIDLVRYPIQNQSYFWELNPKGTKNIIIDQYNTKSTNQPLFNKISNSVNNKSIHMPYISWALLHKFTNDDGK